MVLEADVEERQIVALLADSPKPAFATTNAAAFFRVSEKPERTGIYSSPALDAGHVASFGTLRWGGEVPQGSSVEFSFRSGMSAEPDDTWRAWSDWRSGTEVALADVPVGRYLQWRAQLRSSGESSPRISRVTVSYRQENLAPRIENLTVLGPGAILVPANFNPGNQVFEPVHPNREGIFTRLSPAPPDEGKRLKGLWKKGFRTLRWKASDPNKDSLVFSLFFGVGDDPQDWLEIETDLKSSYFGFDASVLPDGHYRFKLRASDTPDNVDGTELAAEEVSEPVVIDHSPPSLEKKDGRTGIVKVIVRDAMNPLRGAEVSIDAGEWRPAQPADGLLDGQRETLEVTIPEDARLVLLRVIDAAFNQTTFDLLRR